MKRFLKINYKGKAFTAGEQIKCDICTRLIFDSRFEDESRPYYKADNDELLDLCGTECARKIFDGFLDETKHVSEKPFTSPSFMIKLQTYHPERDYNTRIPEDVPVEEYKRLQREASLC